MKKLIIIAIFATATLSLSATTTNMPDYIVTEDGVSYFQKVRLGFSNYLIGISDSGEKVKFRKGDIVSYRKDGDVYVKNTLTRNGKPCNNCEFMKLIRTRHGFSLYSFMCVKNGNYVKKCMVYQSEKFVLEVNEENRLQMIEFFTKTYN